MVVQPFGSVSLDRCQARPTARPTGGALQRREERDQIGALTVGEDEAELELVEPDHAVEGPLAAPPRFRKSVGALFVRGYLASFPPPYELRDFADRDAALAWLGHPCCAAELDELDQARLDLLARLRGWLDLADLSGATLERAAEGLAVTPRTLQRRLAIAQTRFAVEVSLAQIGRAQRLMRDPDRKLSDIALEVGCATPSCFSDLFRRIVGVTPSEWRRR